MSDSSAKLPNKDQFASELNSLFRARIGDAPEFDLTLIESNSQVSNPAQECFTLLFRAPAESVPFQSLYHLDNENLGEMDIFLVPVKQDSEGLYYEAVFNHLLSK